MINPQTTALCSKLKVSDPCGVHMTSSEPLELAGPALPPSREGVEDDSNDADDDTSNSSRILFESFIDSEAGASFLDLSVNDSKRSNNSSRMSVDPDSSLNPEEICLSDEEGDDAEDNDEGNGVGVVSSSGLPPSPIKRTSLCLPTITKSPSNPLSSSILDNDSPTSKDILGDAFSKNIIFDDADEESKGQQSSLDVDAPGFDASTPRHGQIKRRNLDVYASSSRDASDEASISDDNDRSGVLSDTPDVIVSKGGSGSKKFKRRNVAIYTSNEDDWII